jgi:hypothetical protein
MKAVINGDRIECGKCGALLARIVVKNGSKCVPSQDGEWLAPLDWGNKFLETKCKHKDKGVCCNEVNRIEL